MCALNSLVGQDLEPEKCRNYSLFSLVSGSSEEADGGMTLVGFSVCGSRNGVSLLRTSVCRPLIECRC